MVSIRRNYPTPTLVVTSTSSASTASGASMASGASCSSGVTVTGTSAVATAKTSLVYTPNAATASGATTCSTTAMTSAAPKEYNVEATLSSLNDAINKVGSNIKMPEGVVKMSANLDITFQGIGYTITVVATRTYDPEWGYSPTSWYAEGDHSKLIDAIREYERTLNVETNLPGTTATPGFSNSSAELVTGSASAPQTVETANVSTTGTVNPSMTPTPTA